MGQKSLPEMRRFATGALIACAAGTLICHFLSPRHPWLEWPEAFFEAGCIGAIADWFAVVALFRHPFGLPIPHTAVLPNNKDRVADALAQFLDSSFLTEELLTQKFRNFDFSGKVASWVKDNAPRIVEEASARIPALLARDSGESVAQVVSAGARHLFQTVELGPLAAGGLDLLLREGREREIFLQILEASGRLIDTNRPAIQEEIRKEIPVSPEMLTGIPLLKGLAGPLLEQLREKLTQAIADKTIEKIRAILDEAAYRPDHMLWTAFQDGMDTLVDDLRTSREMAERLRVMGESLASSPAVDEVAAKAWAAWKEVVTRNCADAESPMRRSVEEALRAFARTLTEDETHRTEINAVLSRQFVASLLAARPEIRSFVVETIRRWDAEEMATKLETVIGADLQFIRLNGTFVGGLAGLAIHGIFQLMSRFAG